MSVEVERYSTVPLFRDLPPLEIMRLLKIAKDITSKAGEVIVREGERGDGFFVIAKGTFEVRKKSGAAGEPDGGKILAILGEMSFFGEMALVTYAPRAATVICAQEGRLKRFPTEAFEALLEANDIAAYRVVRNMCRILAERLARLGERFVASAPDAAPAAKP